MADRGYIYKITNPVGQIYIGQTKNLERRMESYRKLDCIKQKLIYASLRRYGFNTHRVEILKRCAHSRMDYWELKFINEHRSCYRDDRELGLNILKESYEDYCKLRGEAKTQVKIPIAQYSMSGNLMKVWDTMAQATKKLKIKSGNIAKAIRGDFDSAGGYKWRYYASKA